MDKELAILAARMPNFAEILYKAAREGRISGYTPPTEIIWLVNALKCGPFLP